MNKRMVFYILGQLCKAEAVLLLLPAVVSLIYAESCIYAFLISALISLTAGFLLTIKKPTEKRIYAREGFAVVALAWIIVSIIGALPFFLSREIPDIIDALFETISGFTTTGATILSGVEQLPHAILFWRGLTHWIGGMGVLVFVMAILPLSDSRSMYIMRAEAPGPIVGKLVPKLRDTAKILYLIYFALTAIQTVLLFAGGMSIFESIVHSFSTAGTGGFSTRNGSIMEFSSSYIHIVISVFMVLYGINFTLIYFAIIRNFRQIRSNEEFRWYIGIISASVILIAFDILPMYENAALAFRDAGFQVSSIITTTGFVTADFGKWPELAQAVLIVLMFCGACSGSTGGGIKISRLLLLAKIAKREIRRMIHPQEVSTIRLDGKPLSEASLTGVGTYLTVYLIILLFSVLLLSADRYDFETYFTAVISCLNNTGPLFGTIGPTGNLGSFSAVSKIVLCFDMLFGRLEIFPLLLALSPAVWRHNSHRGFFDGIR